MKGNREKEGRREEEKEEREINSLENRSKYTKRQFRMESQKLHIVSLWTPLGKLRLNYQRV